MATTPKKMFRGAASTSSTTLYTAPSGTGNKAIITSIVVVNTVSVAATFSITIGGTYLAGATTVAANDSVIINDVKIVMDASEVIAGFASATTVNFFISGVELT